MGRAACPVQGLAVWSERAGDGGQSGSQRKQNIPASCNILGRDIDCYCSAPQDKSPTCNCFLVGRYSTAVALGAFPAAHGAPRAPMRRTACADLVRVDHQVAYVSRSGHVASRPSPLPLLRSHPPSLHSIRPPCVGYRITSHFSSWSAAVSSAACRRLS